MQQKIGFSWVIISFMLLLLFFVNLSIGSISIPIKEILRILAGFGSDNKIWEQIVWDFRATKALTCILGGSSLALAGLQMQTLFRNPLAGPDVLGLTSGASLAVSLIFLSNISAVTFFYSQGSWAVAAAASIGCAFVFFIMLAVSQKLTDNVSLLIVGLMVGAGTASLVSVLQYMSSAEKLQLYVMWTFGSLGALSWSEINVLFIVLLTGVATAVANIKGLNIWLLGDRYSQSMGINIKKSRFVSIVSASLLTGAITAFCGPIAFVGLAVPHLIKLIIKTNDHRQLIPAVMVGGATLLLFCDILAQAPGSGRILPINAITALIGAPVVIWVIAKNKVVRS